MKKTFLKNLFRNIKRTLPRFLSIVIIIAVGVAFYAGIRATRPSMEMSGDSYLAKYNFMDFKLISTLGMTRDDLSEIKRIKGISKVEGSFSIDAVVERDKRSLVLNINSIPAAKGINTFRIVEGRMAERFNEAVAEDRFLEDNKLKIGDEIVLESGNESNISDKLKNTRFKIVGSAQSPQYLSAQRQLSSVGNGSVRGFVYILPDVFKSDVYSEIYVKIESDYSKYSLLNNEDYKKAAESIGKKLKDIGIIRSKARYDEVLNEALDKINEAEEKLNNSRKEAEDKFADGFKKLEDAQSKIVKGKNELENNQLLYNRKMADGEKQINDGKKQLLDSQKKLESGKKSAADNISSAMKVKVEEAKRQLDSDPGNQRYIVQFNTLNQIYEKDIKEKDFDEMYDSLKAHGALEQMKPFFDMEALKRDFNVANEEIEAGREKIATTEAQLNKAKQEGLTKLADARKKLSDGQKEIDDNIKKLKAEENKADTEINNGEMKIQKNKEKLKDIKSPKWYVLGRSSNVGYETYRADSERIGNIGKIFPLLFFLVAALVSLTTMTRMVQENRTEIGIFKALGYSRTAIVSHYLIYSMLASILGSIIGMSFAFRLFPPLIMRAYESLYTIPEKIAPFDTKLAFQASLLAILFTTIAAVAATLEELREVPAALMRPKSPKAGRTILLEKAVFIWKRLSFTRKVTARNIFRYKQRFFMTVIGIAACTGLMITGFGIKGGIKGATENQFSKIYRYDMQATLDKNINMREKDSIKNRVVEYDNMESVLFTYSGTGSVKDGNNGTQDAFVVVPEDKDEFDKYINLIMNGRKLELDENGIIITEKLSDLIDKKVGETVQITLDDKVVRANISAVTEHYVQHYIYMSPDYYKKITGESLEFDGFYGLLANKSESAQNETSKVLTEIEHVDSLSYKNNIHIDYDKSMESIDSVVLILILSAGVLAFVVIFNLTNINISERKRELATIKLLGFYDHELALYIYRENIILTIIGSFAGVGLGIILNNFVLYAAETNVIMFLKTVKPIYFLYSVLITISFSIVVNLAMYGEFDRIDMIESLKNAE